MDLGKSIERFMGMMRMKRLTDICEIQYGYAFDSKCFTQDSSYPQLVRIRDVKRGYSETYYSGDYPEEYILSEGDLLVGMDGEFNIARWKCSRALLNQRVCKLTAKVGTNEEYLRFAMSKSLKKIEQRTAFVTVKHLSAKELNKLELDVPELAKQDIIADTLSRLERIIELRNKELQLLDELIKARFVEMFGDPILNPNGYLKETIKKHIDLLSGYPFKSEQYVEEGINICGGLIIMPQKIKWNECVHLGSIKGFEDYLLKDNDIVMALDRPWISEGFKIAKVDAEHLPALLIQRTARIRAIDINQDYLYYCFIEGGFDKYCNVTGSVVPHISAKDIGNFEVMIPPMELQNQFADFVYQVDKSKVAIEKELKKTQLLFDSLMQKYFG